MSKMKETVPMEATTLLGDIRDAVLDRVRRTEKPWEKMTTDEQGAEIDGCTKLARYLVETAARIIAAQGFPTVTGKLVKVQVKDGMQLQVDMSRHDPQRLTMLDNVGRPVLIVVAEPEMFVGERTRPRTSLEEKFGLKP